MKWIVKYPLCYIPDFYQLATLGNKKVNKTLWSTTSKLYHNQCLDLIYLRFDNKGSRNHASCHLRNFSGDNPVNSVNRSLIYFVKVQGQKKSCQLSRSWSTYLRLTGNLVKLMMCCLLKFIYSEKGTKFCEISTNYLSYVLPVK